MDYADSPVTVTVDTNTLDDAPTNTFDCQLIPRSAHFRLRSKFGCIAERTSPTGQEPKAQEQFEDFMSRRYRVTCGRAQFHLLPVQ